MVDLQDLHEELDEDDLKFLKVDYIKFNVDDIVLRMTRDQDFLKALQNLTTYRFDNTTQALNVLASHGWEVRSAMVVRGRNGDEQHFVMARPVDSMMPASPWLEQRSGDRSRQK